MSIEVMKQALEALEQYHGYMEPLTTVFGGPRVPAEQSTTSKVENAITSLRQAIATEEDNYQGSDAAKAAHMMDLYTALGVKWGEDPFAVIAKMREAATEESSATQEPVAWPKGRDLFLRDDMGEGQLRVMFDGDNDVVVAIWPYGQPSASVEFCNGFNGGGKSLETRKALIALMCAMERDGAQDRPHDGDTHPQPKAEQEPKREWVGLTQKEARDLWESTDLGDDWELLKRVEAKLKEKNSI